MFEISRFYSVTKETFRTCNKAMNTIVSIEYNAHHIEDDF
jgi:hypothetical protein